jgi:hypothetical protein
MREQERDMVRNWVWRLLEQYCATCDTFGGGHKSWCPLA